MEGPATKCRNSYRMITSENMTVGYFKVSSKERESDKKKGKEKCLQLTVLAFAFLY